MSSFEQSGWKVTREEMPARRLDDSNIAGDVTACPVGPDNNQRVWRCDIILTYLDDR